MAGGPNAGVKVLYFAAVRERVGTSFEVIALPEPATVQGVVAEVLRRHPELTAIFPHLRLSLNCEFSTLDAGVHLGDEVALIPPVSGGNGRAQLCRGPIDVDSVRSMVANTSAGAVVMFAGSVRDQTRGQAVVRLEYEAYEAMALREMERLLVEAQAKAPGLSAAVVHRLGTLYPGEVAVVVAVASPHRGQAFAACSELVDALKTRVPIWKKEVYGTGASWVGLEPEHRL